MKYRRVIITKHGNPEVLRVIEDELPEPKPGEARIKLLAAGIAWADVMMRTGLYPGSMPPTPFTPGYDMAGIVDKLGDGESSVRVGQPVTTITKMGGYSEYLCAPQSKLVAFPEGLDPAQVTCLPLNYITAYQILHRFAKVRSGERVLIHGAAGGVGTAFLQLGSLAGLEMYGTASQKKRILVQKLGGTPIDYQMEDFVERIIQTTGDGVDAAFDPIGGGHLKRSFDSLRPGGRLIAYGERAIVGYGKFNSIEAQTHKTLMNSLNTNPSGKTVQWYEVYDNTVQNPEWFHEDMAILLDMLASEKIVPVIAERLPLEKAAYAHELLEASAVQGKIVLICNK